MSERNALFIASEVRSGSTYIAEAIAYHFQNSFGYSLFDLTKEHFADLNDKSTPGEILGIYDSLYQDHRGWVTCKIMCPALSIILRESRKSEQVCESVFGANSHWIIVRRRSKIEQAVSLAFARRTGNWHSYEGDEVSSELLEVGPKDVEDALRAILLSDTYLEALAGFIPDQRKSVVHYEDFMATPLPFIARLYGVLGLPNVGDQVTYVDETKIRRDAIVRKHCAAAEFSAWLTQNYHAVERRMGEHANRALSVTEDQELFYEKRISELQSEVEVLKQRLNGERNDRGRSKAAFELQRSSAKKLLKRKE
jgi:hypothetical protein